jgi:hypothetical protein
MVFGDTKRYILEKGEVLVLVQQPAYFGELGGSVRIDKLH